MRPCHVHPSSSALFRRSHRLFPILVVVIASLGAVVAASPARAQPKTQLITPPYDSAHTDDDGYADCLFIPPGPDQTCEELAEPSASAGTLHTRVHIAVPSPQFLGRSAFARADAKSTILHSFTSKDKRGERLDVTFVIDVSPTPTASATPGDHAEIFLLLRATAGCDVCEDLQAFALAVDNCPGLGCVTDGCPCLDVGTHLITLTVPVPAHGLLDGRVEMTLHGSAILESQERLTVEEQPHEAMAEASVSIPRIEIQRS